MREVKRHHVIEFLGDLMNAPEHHHHVFIENRGVPASWIGCFFRMDLTPLIGLQVEHPGVVEALIVFISPSEYVHSMTMQGCGMARTGLGGHCISRDDIPPVLSNVVHDHLICPLSIDEAPEDDHSLLVNDRAMVIPDSWGITPWDEYIPLEGLQVEDPEGRGFDL